MLHSEDALPHQQKLSLSISSHPGVRLDLLVPFVWNAVKDTRQAEEHDRRDQSREQTVMLPCWMASIQFRLCRRVLGETRMKSKHSAEMRAWGMALIKQKLPLSPFQHSILPQLFPRAEFGISLLYTGTNCIGTNLTPAPGCISPRAVGPLQPLPSSLETLSSLIL